MRLTCAGSGSNGNCYLLQTDNDILILDAGISIKTVLPIIDFQISKISGILVSHSHSDHDGYASGWKERGIKVVRPFDDSNKNTTIKKGSTFSFKPFKLIDSQGRWVHTNGDGTECPIYGYYIKLPNNEILVYATDIEFIKYKFKNVNHFLIESNYDLEELENENNNNKSSKHLHHVFQGHHSIQAACKFIQANMSDELKTVTLCHLSLQNGSPEKFKTMMQEVVGDEVRVYIAKKGLDFEL